MNPEFRRNLWLEMSQHRLIAMPLLLALVFGLAIASDGSVEGEGVTFVALAGWILLVMVWGGRQAGQAVSAEASAHTWDHQRLSSLSAWQMSWGKLYGAPVYTLYGGLICLIMLGLSIADDFTAMEATLYLVTALFMGLLTHSVAFLVTLAGSRRGQQPGRFINMIYQAPVVLAGLTIFSSMAAAWPFTDPAGGVLWYGLEMSPAIFIALSLVLFYAWSVAGVHQLMRRELQMLNSPLVWIAFILFALIYSSGTGVIEGRYGSEPGAHHYPPLEVRFFMIWMTCYALVVVTILLESKDVVVYRGLFAALRQGNLVRAGYLVPRWIFPLGILFLALIGVCFTTGGGSPEEPGLSDFLDSSQPAYILISQTLFLLRDMAIVLYLCLGNKKQSGEIWALVYIGVLYLILPWLLAAILNEGVLFLFYSVMASTSPEALFPPLAQAAFAGILVYTRWSRLRKQTSQEG